MDSSSILIVGIFGAVIIGLISWAVFRALRKTATPRRVQRLPVAWADVPFEDRPTLAKRRPVVLVGGGYLKCTSQDKSGRSRWYYQLTSTFRDLGSVG